MDETNFEASRVVIWQYDRVYLSAIVDDAKSDANAVAAAKAILEKMNDR